MFIIIQVSNYTCFDYIMLYLINVSQANGQNVLFC